MEEDIVLSVELIEAMEGEIVLNVEVTEVSMDTNISLHRLQRFVMF